MKKKYWKGIISLLATPVLRILGLVVIVFCTGMLSYVAFGVSVFISFLMRFNWILALMVSIFIVYLAFECLVFLWNLSSSLRKFKNLFGSVDSNNPTFAEQYPVVAISTLAVGCAFFVCVGLAGLSNVMHEQSTVVKYSLVSNVESPPLPTDELHDYLIDFYFWHFVDAIPGLQLYKYTSWTCPLKYEGNLAGVIVAFSRFSVIFLIVSIIKAWSEVYNKGQAKILSRVVRKSSCARTNQGYRLTGWRRRSMLFKSLIAN